MKAQSVEMAVEQVVTTIDESGNQALLAMSRDNDASLMSLAIKLGEAQAQKAAAIAQLADKTNECEALREELQSVLLMTGTDGAVAH